jgi:hypothetical protein
MEFYTEAECVAETKLGRVPIKVCKDAQTQDWSCIQLSVIAKLSFGNRFYEHQISA